jgi:hypothetical protein
MGGELGDAARAGMRVTLVGGVQVSPIALADLGDNDNYTQLCLDTDTPAETLRDFQVAIFAQDQPVLESQQPKTLPLSGGEAMSVADRLSAAYRRYLKAQGIGFGTC